MDGRTGERIPARKFIRRLLRLRSRSRGREKVPQTHPGGPGAWTCMRRHGSLARRIRTSFDWPDPGPRQLTGQPASEGSCALCAVCVAAAGRKQGAPARAVIGQRRVSSDLLSCLRCLLSWQLARNALHLHTVQFLYTLDPARARIRYCTHTYIQHGGLADWLTDRQCGWMGVLAVRAFSGWSSLWGASPDAARVTQHCRASMTRRALMKGLPMSAG